MGIPITRATVGGKITAGNYNQLVDALTLPPIARVSKVVAQNTHATPATNTAVAFDVETFDDYLMHDNVTNNSRLTIPTGWDGYYMLTGRVRANHASAKLTAQFAKNGVQQGDTSDVRTGTATANPFTLCVDTILLAAGDYVEVWVQSDVASVPLVPANCTFSIQFMHA